VRTCSGTSAFESTTIATNESGRKRWESDVGEAVRASIVLGTEWPPLTGLGGSVLFSDVHPRLASAFLPAPPRSLSSPKPLHTLSAIISATMDGADEHLFTCLSCMIAFTSAEDQRPSRSFCVGAPRADASNPRRALSLRTSPLQHEAACRWAPSCDRRRLHPEGLGSQDGDGDHVLREGLDVRRLPVRLSVLPLPAAADLFFAAKRTRPRTPTAHISTRRSTAKTRSRRP
jgi:hypothetical protein